MTGLYVERPQPRKSARLEGRRRQPGPRRRRTDAGRAAGWSRAPFWQPAVPFLAEGLLLRFPQPPVCSGHVLGLTRKRPETKAQREASHCSACQFRSGFISHLLGQLDRCERQLLLHKFRCSKLTMTNGVG